MAQAGSLARALCIPGVAMQSHPTCIQRHIYVGLDLLNIRRLSMVGRCWSDTGRAIIAEVKDAATATVYEPLPFSVDALGNLFENAADADEKLTTSMRRVLRMVEMDELALLVSSTIASACVLSEECVINTRYREEGFPV